MPSLAPYDETVPHPRADARLAERFAALRERRPAVDLARVRELVVVVSSSRGGCTMLGELLRRCPSLLALPAESNPYVVVAQLGAEDPAGVVAAELARVIGRPARDPDPDTEAFGLEWAWRLTAQWPRRPVDPDDVVRWVREAREPAEVLARAGVDPRRYDLPDRSRSRAAAGAPSDAGRAPSDAGRAPRDAPRAPSDAPSDDSPAGPPGDLLVEMPPFVVPRPWRLATDDELASRPLVLATPRNAYRVDFLASLFPTARVRLVHLVRNPAASVNGLVDGWLHHGFFNCEVPRELGIRGYSDLHPWGRTWWNYDIPPEWEAFTAATLPEVCAEQWRATHEAALDAAERFEHHALRYEDLVGQPDERQDAARGLADFLGVPHGDLVPLAVNGLDPVMATAPPSPGRWRARERELEGVLRDGRIRALAERLGYAPDPAAWA